MNAKRIFSVIFLLMLMFVFVLPADSKEDLKNQDTLSIKKVCLTGRITLDKILVDGRIDEEGWEKVEWSWRAV
jgi:hypothetical protein